MALDLNYFQSMAGMTPTAMPLDGFQAGANSGFPSYSTQLRDSSGMVGDAMAAALDPNSAYIQNARRRGLEVAAARGGLNSSIAAGSSERAAIDAAMPLAQRAMDIDATREGVQASNWLGQQNSQRQAQIEEWMSTNNFNRSIIGQYAMGTFNNTMDMLGLLGRQAVEDPELYTPDVVSGYSNFFQQNFNDILSRYFRGN